MTTSDHLLLVSEDQGNAAALRHASATLSDGATVTWICSTQTSQTLEQLEAASALKNNNMATLNLLVITRDESQPFAVLTGELNRERIRQCAGQLFDPRSVSQVAVAGSAARQAEVAGWIAEEIPDVEARLLAVHADQGTGLESDSAADSAIGAPDTVAVTVILQGRELQFDMARTAGTLLDGAEDAGLDLPFSCRGGVCSTCRSKLTRGEVALIENYALEDWELEAGFTLPCQAEPLSDEITLDYDEV